jgi:hypothetical protein
MHPWHGKTFTERKASHAELKQWLKDHPLLRLRHGAMRDDGKVFAGYSAGYVNGEHWTTPECFQRRLECSRKAVARARARPNYRAEHNDYIKNRYPNKEMRRRKTRERGAAWRKANPEKVAQKTRRRYALKKGRAHPENDRIKEMAIFKQAARLTKETGIKHHVDHIIPLMHGGWHHHDNLQVVTIAENLQKNADPFHELPGRKTWRDVPRHLWPESLAEEYARRAA